MSSLRLIAALLVAAIMALGRPASFMPDAEGCSWVVRPLAVDVSAENLDVMVGPNGKVIVGYATSMQAGLGGDVVLASLASGDKFFSRRSEIGGGNAASFAAGQYGNVFYASRDVSGNGMRVGEDFGGFGSMTSSLHPDAAFSSRLVIPTVGINLAGTPVVANIDVSGARTLSTFNVAQGKWQTESLSTLGLDSSATPAGSNCQSLAFDSAGDAVLSYVRRTGNTAAPLVVARRNAGGWANLASDTALAPYGTSVAVNTDNTIGFAYVNASGSLCFNSYRDGLNVLETVSTKAGYLTSHSLAYDAAGNVAVAYVESSSTSTSNVLHLARRSTSGTWSDEILPVRGQRVSLAFDANGNALVAVCSSAGISLLGTNIAALQRGDFDLNDTVAGNDVKGFVQALRRQKDYFAAQPNMVAPDLLPLGDYNGDGIFNDSDARLFADSLTANPLPDLANRKAGYVAMDQADADPALGSGKGNFFGVTLATGKSYRAGDSRGDLTGVTVAVPDGTINAKDIDYLFQHMNASDARADMDGNGLIEKADVTCLVTNILGTNYGDANLDRAVSFVDFLSLRAHFNQSGGWANGDFNGDGKITFPDFLLLRANFGSSAPEELVALDAFAISVPEPTAGILLIALAITSAISVVPPWYRQNRRAKRLLQAINRTVQPQESV